jgi:hypothetical protein
MDIRRSPATERNALVVKDRSAPGVSNAAWLMKNAPPGAVVFVGGAGLTDFRVRVAQSHLRNDMFPSFWSLVGVATSRGMLTVSLSAGGDPSVVPATNAVRLMRLQEIDDAAQYPNIAAIEFADNGAAIVANAERLIKQRNAIDLPSMLLTWLGFAWGAGTRRNPLLENVGLPAAAFVETAFGMDGIELTPGLSSGSSCPEAIWQSALWWHDYYKKTASVPTTQVTTARSSERIEEMPKTVQPHGLYRVLQPAAAVTYEGKGPRPASKRRASKRS